MEKYTNIYMAEALESRRLLRKGNAISFEIDAENTLNSRYRLFFAGETAVHYTYKSEDDCTVLYNKIDDALCTKKTHHSRYSLCLSGCDYPKIAYKKLLSAENNAILPENIFGKVRWSPLLSYLPLSNFTDDWKFGIWASGENIKLKENGYLRMTLEVRFENAEHHRRDVSFPADLSYVFNFDEGNYDFKKLSQDIVIPKDKAVSVCIFIEGEGFEGSLYLEEPFLISSNGFNILPTFEKSTAQRSGYNWVGQNLSKTEWPEFELSLNDEVFYKGEIFERCHRNSECEINIPDNLMRDGKNTVTLKLITDMEDAPPYLLNELGIISEPRHAFDVISCPQIVTAAKPFSLLIQINEPSDLELCSDIVNKFDDEAFSFKESGLYAVRLICDKIVNDLTFTLKSDKHTELCTIQRCLEKTMDDGVITGTSDIVYVNQKKEDFENFLRFYFSEQLGNLLTFRPVYRWSGARKYNRQLFEQVVPLLNKLNVKYSHMTDGREQSGIIANPPLSIMSKVQDGIQSGFLGRQKHERDGSYNYWTNRSVDSYENELSHDLIIRAFLKHTDCVSHEGATPTEVFYNGDKRVFYRPSNLPDNMQGMCDFVLSQLYKTRYDNTRHTGPSIMFKYFYEAGYDWVGAELMYGPLEPIVAAMRGAYRGYKKQNGFGAHHALQWSTCPHDVPEKYRRYLLALYTSYMHGITEINLEEGLVHIEQYFSYFNRFSDCCKQYIKIQKDFNKYIQSHTRSGEFYSPFAFIHGRCDGFSIFSRTRVWGRDDWDFCDAEKSWDIIKLFYPVSVLDSIYKHFPDSTKPLGFNTGTPRGNTDIIPIESHCFERYKAISFTGYNKAEMQDFDAILSYVKNGGTLIMGWPHVSVTTDRSDIENGQLEFLEHSLTDYLSSSKQFTQDSYNGIKITVNPDVKADEVIATTDSGIPLAVIRKIGLGQVFFINAQQYPAHDGVKKLYEAIICEVSDNINAEEKIFAKVKDDVSFTIYDQADGSRHLYLLAVDWYNSPEKERKAALKIGRDSFDISVPFGKMLKVVAKDSIAVWSEDQSIDVLLISGNIVTLGGYGKSSIRYIKNGELKVREIDFTNKPLQAIML